MSEKKEVEEIMARMRRYINLSGSDSDAKILSREVDRLSEALTAAERELEAERTNASILGQKCESLRSEVSALKSLLAKKDEVIVRMSSVLKMALPESMGGYPDLFSPKCGWEDWEDDAVGALHSALALSPEKEEKKP